MKILHYQEQEPRATPKHSTQAARNHQSTGHPRLSTTFFQDMRGPPIRTEKRRRFATQRFKTRRRQPESFES
jgi:hypothetical protein